MIRVDDLRKSYGGNVALAGVTFSVEAGETFGLLGPNGAGKTTTIGCICGLVEPGAGGVRIADVGGPADPNVRRILGVAPQTLAVYDGLTAEENVTFFGQMYGLGGVALKYRVQECLAMAGLEERRGGRVAGFSGGMKRRLNLACALVHDPTVILLDEPTVGVDPQSRSFIFDTLAALKKRGTTILYTTHYMEEAQRLCDRVAIVDHGLLVQCDTVSGLIARHGGPVHVRIDLLEEPSSSADLPGTLDGLQLSIQTDEPARVIADLHARNLRYSSLRIDQPSLEDVFLSLTGRSLRDE